MERKATQKDIEEFKFFLTPFSDKATRKVLFEKVIKFNPDLNWSRSMSDDAKRQSVVCYQNRHERIKHLVKEIICTNKNENYFNALITPHNYDPTRKFVQSDYESIYDMFS